MALSSSCNKDTDKSCLEPPNQNKQQIPMKMPTRQASSATSPWAVDEFLHFSDLESSDKVKEIYWKSITFVFLYVSFFIMNYKNIKRGAHIARRSQGNLDFFL